MSNKAQLPENPFAAHQQLLRERLHHLLSNLHPSLQSDVRRALEEPGKLLCQSSDKTPSASHSMPDGSWSLLTLLVAQHFSTDIDLAIASSVAVATECFACALDILDDVEDEDQTPIIRDLGVARALNISTALLTLAQHAFLSLSKVSIRPALILRLLDAMDEATLAATSGQHRDLLAEQRMVGDVTREECVDIAASKAGAIMRFACLLGAICAGASKAERAAFAEVGELIGIAHQLDNDAHDLYYLLESADVSSGVSTERSVKTDLARGKKTLPIVLAAGMSSTLQKSSALSDDEIQVNQGVLREGIMTTWAISLLYRARANDRLRAIPSRKSLAPELLLLLGIE